MTFEVAELSRGVSYIRAVFGQPCGLCGHVKEMVQKARLASAGSRVTRGPSGFVTSALDGEGCGWDGAEAGKIRVLEPRIMDPFIHIPLGHTQ